MVKVINIKNKDFLSLAKSRKTTYEFSKKPVKESQLKNILEAGRWAPSCSNIQPWYFVVVKNKKTISKIMKIAYYGDFHTDPNILVVLLLRMDICTGEHRCIKRERISILEGNLCVAMAAANMIFEATSLAIGSCILSPETKKVLRILNMQNEKSVPLMLGFGYEKKGAYQKIRERKNLTEIVTYK